jgi:hypothetical protein
MVGVVALTLPLQACGLLFHIGPEFRLSGLDFADEFDKVFSMAGACATESWKQRSKELGLKPPDCRPIADRFLKEIRKNQEAGVRAKDYLRSKGGDCVEAAKSHWRCTVERVVTTTAYMSGVQQGPPHGDRYVLKVEIREPSGDIRTDFERYHISSTETKK